MLCCTFLQHFNGEVLALLCDIIEVFIEVLYLVGVLFCLESVLQTFLHWVIRLHVLSLLESHGAVDWASSGFEQFDFLEIILVNSPRVVSNQPEASRV